MLWCHNFRKLLSLGSEISKQTQKTWSFPQKIFMKWVQQMSNLWIICYLFSLFIFYLFYLVIHLFELLDYQRFRIFLNVHEVIRNVIKTSYKIMQETSNTASFRDFYGKIYLDFWSGFFPRFFPRRLAGLANSQVPCIWCFEGVKEWKSRENLTNLRAKRRLGVGESAHGLLCSEYFRGSILELIDLIIGPFNERSGPCKCTK